jgi:hypothetical protein
LYFGCKLPEIIAGFYEPVGKVPRIFRTLGTGEVTANSDLPTPSGQEFGNANQPQDRGGYKRVRTDRRTGPAERVVEGAGKNSRGQAGGADRNNAKSEKPNINGAHARDCATIRRKTPH